MLKVEWPPISINKCWQGRRFKTKDYTAWRKAVGQLLAVQKIEMTDKRAYTVMIKVFVHNYAMLDVDNCIKPILDALVENHVLIDDRRVTTVIASKYPIDKSKKEYFEIYIQ